MPPALPIARFGAREDVSALTLSTAEGDEFTLVREPIVTLPIGATLALMQDVALRALDREVRSPAVAELTVEQATQMHALYEISVTSALLAQPQFEQAALLTDIAAYAIGWEDVTGLEGIYTSALALVSQSMGPELLAPVSIFWQQEVVNGAYAREHGAFVAASDGVTVAGFPPGLLNDLGLSAGYEQLIAGIDLGPSGWGAGLSSFGYGAKTVGGHSWSVSRAQLASMTSGYPNGHFDAGFTPGVFGGDTFLQAERRGGLLTAPPGASGVPGMLGDSGFVPGVFGADGAFTAASLASGTLLPLTVGPDFTGTCPIDESYLTDEGSSLGMKAVHGAAGEIKALAQGFATAGLTAFLGAAAVGAGALATGARPVAIGAAGMMSLSGHIVAGASVVAVAASAVEAVTKPSRSHAPAVIIETGGPTGPATSHPGETAPATAPGTTPAPAGGTVIELGDSLPEPDAFAGLGLPASWSSIFPDVNCPDPFGGGLLGALDAGITESVDLVPQLADDSYSLLGADMKPIELTDQGTTAVRLVPTTKVPDFDSVTTETKTRFRFPTYENLSTPVDVVVTDRVVWVWKDARGLVGHYR